MIIGRGAAESDCPSPRQRGELTILPSVLRGFECSGGDFIASPTKDACFFLFFSEERAGGVGRRRQAEEGGWARNRDTTRHTTSFQSREWTAEEYLASVRASLPNKGSKPRRVGGKGAGRRAGGLGARRTERERADQWDNIWLVD